jgi:hypothetical protein
MTAERFSATCQGQHFAVSGAKSCCAILNGKTHLGDDASVPRAAIFCVAVAVFS